MSAKVRRTIGGAIMVLTLAGAACSAAAQAGSPEPLALAARVPPPGGDALQVGRGPVHECPSVAGVEPRIGTAWQHRRKFGGVGPAVGGWCLLNKADRHSISTTP